MVTTYEPPPVTGGNQFQHQTSVACRNDASTTASLASNVGVNLPRVSFPLFDGSNHRIWKKHCESYFYMHVVPQDHWVKLVVMHFERLAVYWYKSVEHRIDRMNWEEVCLSVCSRFGKDDHSALTC